MIRRPPRSTQSRSSAASDVYKRQGEARPVPGQREADPRGGPRPATRTGAAPTGAASVNLPPLPRGGRALPLPLEVGRLHHPVQDLLRPDSVAEHLARGRHVALSLIHISEPT